MNMPEKIRAFVRKEIVLVISAIAAAVSCLFVLPDAEYGTYFDWHTLALLLSLMIVVSGLRVLGVVRVLGEWIVSRMRSKMMIGSGLVALTFGCSMFITNDVALITFVPFAIVVMHKARMDRFMGPVVALMTIAANLGSMLLPMGNPQNLYLFQSSQINMVDFVLLMVPYSLCAALLLVGFLLVVFCVQGEEVQSKKEARGSKHSKERSMKHLGRASEEQGKKTSLLFRRTYPLGKCLRAGVYGVLFVLCLCAVMGVLGVFLVCVIVVLVAALMDRRVFKYVDYGLLATFVVLFVFVGNMGRIPLVYEGISQLVSSAPVFASVLLSQIISNVPTALLLSGFTDQWGALIVGTNLGGLGTLIASMASIISFKLITTEGLVGRKEYLKTFTWYNAVFLIILLLLYGALRVLG